MLNTVFDTFKEPISIYKTATETFISSSNDYNFVFGGNNGAEVTTNYIVNSGVFQATVEFIDQQDNQNKSNEPSDTPFLSPKGKIHISLEIGAREFMRGCEKIMFDNESYRVISCPMARGIFARNFVDFWLEPIDL